MEGTKENKSERRLTLETDAMQYRKQTVEIKRTDYSGHGRTESTFLEETDKQAFKLSGLQSMKGIDESKKSVEALPSVTTSVSSATVMKSSRNLKMFNFMSKRLQHRIIIDDIDYTPDNLVAPDYVTMEDSFTHAAFDVKPFKSELNIDECKSKSIKSTISAGDGAVKIYATTIDIDDIYIDYTINTQEAVTERDKVDILTPAPSAFYLPRMNPLTSHPPEILVTLKETDTVFLYDLNQLSFDKNTADATSVEVDNEFYQFITVGKGRNRKMVNQETQTILTIAQTRHTLATRPEKKNATSFASMWDMHDTYAAIEDFQPPEEEDEMVLYQCAAAHLLRKKKKKPRHDQLKLTFDDMSKSSKFLDAALITQRVMASKKFSSAQKRFRGLVDMDPYSLDLVYIYTMRALWTLESEETTGRPITSISFNPKNENILAVGYGKFGFAEKRRGLVCIWNTKNPCKPERSYWFTNPLTSVAFSSLTPNALALGFCNGDVMIIDITFYTIKILAVSKRETNPSYEPIWVTEWHVSENKQQYVMTACQDGRISKFISTKTHDFICVPMMRICTSEGKLRGIDLTRPCLKEDVPIDRHPAALCLKWLPSAQHMYMVGTEEGCVHRCSTHYLNQHVEVFRVHAGPVYYMEFSPFQDTLFLTCGADGAIRLWIEGIDVVIITLTCDTAVLGAAFCPINSTVILSVSGNVLSVWDLRRKTHIPCAEHIFSPNVTLTYIKFSTSGDNVFVGDSKGCVHTFHIEDTPIPPFFQRKLLEDTIKKALCTRPHLLKQLQKMENYTRINTN